MKRLSHRRGSRDHTGQAGFTLVEMIVAVALFSVVMLVAVGALLSLTGANRKAQALQSVMNNLNIALDGMVRSIRMGSNFHCGGGNLKATADCALGDTAFAFEPFGNTNTDPPWVYSYDPATKRVYKSENGQAAIAITAPEVSIDDLRFFVTGSTKGDTTQPKVVVVVRGTAGASHGGVETTFHIQATAVERALDLQ